MPSDDMTISAKELAVVVPTFKEKDNIEPVLERLAAALVGIEYEVIFVDDDSPDGTAEVVRRIGLTNPRVRVIHRVNRRGLASACIEGMMSTAAPAIAVMDADLQHDESILPEMLRRLKAERLDLVVASRNTSGGSMGEFAAERVKLSQLGRRLSQVICKADLSDPMSGFFLVSRSFLMEVVHGTSAIGFKILIDLVTSLKRPLRFAEVPYTFRQRLHGDSKLDLMVSLEYLQLLLDKLVGGYIPPRFVIFAMVGTVGMTLSVLLLWVLLQSGSTFLMAQTVTTVVAMTANFFLNNITTYRDRRLRGAAMVRGLLTFYAACAIGAFISIRLADSIRPLVSHWVVASAIGLVVGAVWNYGVTSLITWRGDRLRIEKKIAREALVGGEAAIR